MNTDIDIQKTKVEKKQKIYDDNHALWKKYLEYSNSRTSELRSDIHSNKTYKGVTVWIAICFGISGVIFLWYNVIVTALCFACVYGFIQLYNLFQGFIENHEGVISENKKRYLKRKVHLI